MKSKIYITGAAGFIGFHTTKKLLNKGIEVHGFDSMNNYYDFKLKKARLDILKKYKNFTFTKGSLENTKVLNNSILKFKPTTIIHLAAQAGVRYSLENPDTYLNSNVIGTFNILKISNEIKVKHLIIGSSSSVYGANKKFPFKEIDKTDHQVSFYAATKKSTESLAHSYSSLWRIPITMLRFFTVYGPWGRPDMAYFKFTDNIIKNKIINVYNSGKHNRSFTYIDDIIDSIYLLYQKYNSNNKYYKLLNIGSNCSVSVLELIKNIELKIGKKAKLKYLPKQPGDVNNTASNCNKLNDLINFSPKINIKDGIIKFIDWYTEFYDKKI